MISAEELVLRLVVAAGLGWPGRAWNVRGWSGPPG